MNLLIIITSSIILLLIIFCSWNIFYENYTDLLNSGKNLLVTDNNGNASKYSVDSFTSVINKYKTDISNLYVRFYSYSYPYDLYNRINTSHNFMSQVFPNSIYELKLYDSYGSSKSFNYKHFGILTGNTPVTIFNPFYNKYVKATAGTVKTGVIAQTVTAGALTGTLSQWTFLVN